MSATETTPATSAPSLLDSVRKEATERRKDITVQLAGSIKRREALNAEIKAMREEAEQIDRLLRAVLPRKKN